MKCERCKKREATVHLTEIRNAEKREVHLCEHCATDQGLPGKQHFTIQELLAGMTQAQQRRTRTENEPSCARCGLRLSQFQSSGRFGCADCYLSFKDEVMPLVEKIHDNSQHVGRVPKHVSEEVGLQKEIRQLQTEQKKAIRRQAYEEAARLRDRILELQKRLEAPATPADVKVKDKPKSRRSGAKSEPQD